MSEYRVECALTFHLVVEADSPEDALAYANTDFMAPFERGDLVEEEIYIHNISIKRACAVIRRVPRVIP